MQRQFPSEEATRLHVLRQPDVLETPPKSGGLTHLAVQILGTANFQPVPANRQRHWLKSRVGLAILKILDAVFFARAVSGDDISLKTADRLIRLTPG